MKKNLLKAVFICVLTLLTALSPAVSVLTCAAGSKTAEYYMGYTRCAVVYDVDAEIFLHEKNRHKKVPVGSITKVITSLVGLKYASPDDIYTVGSELNLVHSGSSLCGIRRGQRLTLRDLIYGMMLPSGIDAAYTVAVNVARKVSKNKRLSDASAVNYFCSLMNGYCASIGAEESHFVNPGGWDNAKQHTSAGDLVKIGRQVLKNPLMLSIVGKKYKKCTFASGQVMNWYNTNQMLNKNSAHYYKYCRGIKTGTTGGAGCCVFGYAEKNGHKLITAVLGCNTFSDRYMTAKGLFEVGFSELAAKDAAERKAAEEKALRKAAEEEARKKKDAEKFLSCSGPLTAADARFVLRCSVGLEICTAEVVKKADIDADGTVTAADARKILRIAVGLEIFPDA